MLSIIGLISRQFSNWNLPSRSRWLQIVRNFVFLLLLFLPEVLHTMYSKHSINSQRKLKQLKIVFALIIALLGALLVIVSITTQVNENTFGALSSQTLLTAKNVFTEKNEGFSYQRSIGDSEIDFSAAQCSC